MEGAKIPAAFLQACGVAPAPLILTLSLDEASQRRFDDLRKTHFPPERNYLQAHVTLFHALPGEYLTEIEARLEEVTLGTDPFPLQVSSVISLGKGVAFRLESEALQAMHKGLQTVWKGWLTPQDAQKLRPHVTIQNKVTPEAARTLKEMLERAFRPYEVTATGLALWEYAGGPWKALRRFI